ncbi:MAG: UDP-glucose/GDP-mannose dehydrogenase [Magnetococcales bacterium]|nr:UDP-glucose/GDP-mannose dehydrogenase [Magnetococcales bacterium]HIJ83476.1 nucleotide sugar dehydrogenase [Magnetococcales bacterium]
MKTEFLEKIRQRQSVIGVLGLGYVGLPLALRFLEEGFTVAGFDIDAKKIDKLERGESYIEHLPAQPFYEAIQKGTFWGTTDFSRIAKADAIILCVPTPLNRNREPDISFITGSMTSILPYLRPGQLLSLESTTYPGTTAEHIDPRVREKGLVIGKDFFVVYSPEREDPANAEFSTRTIPKVCGGTTAACLEAGVALYGAIIDRIVPVSSTAVAEMVKILENTYRSVNIALVNELKLVADRMDMDIFEIINAAATKPFGFKPFFPGPGLGGHCIPIDPFYLTWKAREYGLNTRFIELAGEVNTSMPDYVITKVTDALNDHGKAMRNAKILILGLAYKKNIDDVRESPSFVLLTRLMAKGAVVDYSDPHVAAIPPMRAYSIKKTSVAITKENLSGYDCVVVATDHDRFDWELIEQNSALIVDARGRFNTVKGRIIRA